MSMPFLESPRFPDRLSITSRGGPRYSTGVVSVKSGVEVRNQNWVYPLHSYDAAHENHTHEDIEALIEHFHACAGMYYGFRFKDWADFRSCSSREGMQISANDQVLGNGTGSQTQFQLIKTYTVGAVSRIRQIKKPVFGQIKIAFNGQEQFSGWSVDTTNGVVSFAVAPANGVAITAGYEFDVPVRFASDEFVASWTEYGILSTSIPLQEIRL
jgi:uncharacterized protein (TIGR02217 family)